MLAGCEALHQQIENPARVDPSTIAVYERAPDEQSGGQQAPQTQSQRRLGTQQQQSARRGCSLTGGPYDLYNGALDLDCFTFPGDSSGLTAYQWAVTNGGGERNRLVAILINQSDQVCTRELGRMSAIEAVTNSSLGIASTIMTTAATIITGERANAILSGGATVFNSSRDHLNAHVYRAQLTQAITSAITQERDAIRESIERRFDSKTTEWSIDDGVREVNRYHQTCSFYRGLELVLRATNERSELERRARISALEATLERMAANDPNRQAVQAELILLTTGVTVPNR